LLGSIDVPPEQAALHQKVAKLYRQTEAEVAERVLEKLSEDEIAFIARVNAEVKRKRESTQGIIQSF